MASELQKQKHLIHTFNFRLFFKWFRFIQHSEKNMVHLHTESNKFNASGHSANDIQVKKNPLKQLKLKILVHTIKYKGCQI